MSRAAGLLQGHLLYGVRESVVVCTKLCGRDWDDEVVFPFWII